ncbi:MAG: class F sortase [Renibacterium salmoninarum]|nr:class F sortase [Renibacterium salmoninarum]
MDKQDQNTALRNGSSQPAEGQPRIHGRRSSSQGRRTWILLVIVILTCATALVIAGAAGFGSTNPAAAPLPTLTKPFDEGDQRLGPPDVSPVPNLGPNQLAIPAIGLQIDLVPAPAINGQIQIPQSDLAGLYSQGPSLTAVEGTTLIAGHVNWADGRLAPMSAIVNAKPGDRIFVADAEGAIASYSVSSGKTYRKQSLPDAVFQTQGPRTLALATCSEPITTANGETIYLSNTIITAAPTLLPE